jgi:hypothetical protein
MDSRICKTSILLALNYNGEAPTTIDIRCGNEKKKIKQENRIKGHEN